MSKSNEKRIFLIGFNKCGTTSFHDYFKANGISSVHWRANTLAMTLHRNLNAGKRLLEDIDRWTAYTDMNCIPGSPWGRSNSNSAPLIEGCRYFRELHKENSNALFILNTRDPFDWIRSRMEHDQGNFAKAYIRALEHEKITNEEELSKRWLKDWHEHHAEVLEYFYSAAPEQLLVYHIKKTPVCKLNKFLESYFEITHREFPHHHQSKKRES